jgi:Glyoxalase/Bleomycin resistance protein/Dioxygenase superfamily
MATYDMLHSPDFLVADADGTTERLVRAIGLPPPDPEWIQEFPGHGYRAVFARVHRSRAYAPTRLEVISPRPVPEPADPAVPRAYLDDYARAQGGRPLKTHATVVASSDLPALIERVCRRGLRHRVDPVTPELPHLRLWLGVTPEDPGGYRPDDDAGLFFEAIPTQGLHLRIAPGDPAPPAPTDLAEGAMARVLAREWLVRDLDPALAALARNLDWEPAAPVADDARDGCRRAVMEVTMAHAATLELVQPVADGEAADYLAAHGPGPYYTRIAVAGLEAKAADLASRGTAFRRAGDRLRVAAGAVDGALIEFVELGDGR